MPLYPSSDEMAVIDYERDKAKLDLLYADKPCPIDDSLETWVRNGNSFGSPSAPPEIKNSPLGDKYFHSVNLVPKYIDKYLQSLQTTHLSAAQPHSN